MHVVVIVFIIIAGLTRADAENYKPFMPYDVGVIFVGSAALFFAHVGFDAVSTMAEETENPARDNPYRTSGLNDNSYSAMLFASSTIVPTGTKQAA